jgi:hypothetical protein
MDLHEVRIANGRWVGNVEIVNRSLKILAVLCLAPLAGVSCGRPAESAPQPPFTYSEIREVTLVDRSPNCARLTIGLTVAYQGCFTGHRFPVFVYGQLDHKLTLLAIDTGVIRLIDPGYKVVAMSAHFVAVQTSLQMGENDLRFTLTSANKVRWCRLDYQLFMHCPRFVQTG